MNAQQPIGLRLTKPTNSMSRSSSCNDSSRQVPRSKHNRRHQAYKVQLDSVVNEIPSTVEAIQASHEQTYLVQRRKAKQLQQLATGISSNVEQSIQIQQTSTSQSMDELLVLKDQISALHSTIPQLKNHLEQSSGPSNNSTAILKW